MTTLEFWKKWITALVTRRVGVERIHPTVQRLKDTTGGYCCLGVACRVFEKEVDVLPDCWTAGSGRIDTGRPVWYTQAQWYDDFGEVMKSLVRLDPCWADRIANLRPSDDPYQEQARYFWIANPDELEDRLEAGGPLEDHVAWLNDNGQEWPIDQLVYVFSPPEYREEIIQHYRELRAVETIPAETPHGS